MTRCKSPEEIRKLTGCMRMHIWIMIMYEASNRPSNTECNVWTEAQPLNRQQSRTTLSTCYTHPATVAKSAEVIYLLNFQVALPTTRLRAVYNGLTDNI